MSHINAFHGDLENAKRELEQAQAKVNSARQRLINEYKDRGLELPEEFKEKKAVKRPKAKPKAKRGKK